MKTIKIFVSTFLFCWISISNAQTHPIIKEFEACVMNKNFARCEQLIDTVDFLKLSRQNYASPMANMVNNNQVKLVKKLVLLGDTIENSLLLSAIKSDFYEMTELLLQNKINPNIPYQYILSDDTSAILPIQLALENTKPMRYLTLLKKHKTNFEKAFDCTLWKLDNQTIQYLFLNGAKAKYANLYSLYAPKDNDRYVKLLLFLNKGANVNRTYINKNSLQYKSETLLHKVLRKKDLKTTNLLLLHKININQNECESYLKIVLEGAVSFVKGYPGLTMNQILIKNSVEFSLLNRFLHLPLKDSIILKSTKELVDSKHIPLIKYCIKNGIKPIWLNLENCASLEYINELIKVGVDYRQLNLDNLVIHAPNDEFKLIVEHAPILNKHLAFTKAFNRLDTFKLKVMCDKGYDCMPEMKTLDPLLFTCESDSIKKIIYSSEQYKFNPDTIVRFIRKKSGKDGYWNTTINTEQFLKWEEFIWKSIHSGGASNFETYFKILFKKNTPVFTSHAKPMLFYKNGFFTREFKNRFMDYFLGDTSYYKSVPFSDIEKMFYLSVNDNDFYTSDKMIGMKLSTFNSNAIDLICNANPAAAEYIRINKLYDDVYNWTSCENQNLFNNQKITALMMAIHLNYTDLAKDMIKNGMNIHNLSKPGGANLPDLNVLEIAKKSGADKEFYKYLKEEF